MNNTETLTEDSVSILDRISEQDVCDWLVAKLAAIRADKIPSLHYIDLAIHTSCTVREEPYVAWGMQACGECVVSKKSSAEAVRELCNEIAQHPGVKAAEKKRQAAALLQEAVELEKMARAI